MDLIVIYSGEFGERVIGNLINYSTFCISCAEACTHCKEAKYGFADSIKAFFKLPEPSQLPVFIEDSASEYLPNEFPDADMAIVSEIHNDLLLELPTILKDSGIKAMIVPQESAAMIARPQVEEICDRERIEVVFPKPFCDLHLEPQEDKPLVRRFIAEFGIGRPEVRVEVDKGGRIAHVAVLRSAPCGSTWFVAKQLECIEVENKRELYDRISESHHSYPCTASMEKDRELGDTILHRAGYIIRAAVEAVLL
ncbi:MAG: Thymidylate synthase [Candidatus Methanolliviera sp. GoM_asphalt]|nr:MAG: Thymidylate synthase [Candidatus Methanolliviera sp. GoM_asphalt]